MLRRELSAVILIMLASMAVIAYAEIYDPYVVYGYIKYPGGSPASYVGANVSTPNQTKITVTDSLGRYSVVFDNYLNGAVIKVSASGSTALGNINTSSGASRIDLTAQGTPAPTPTATTTATPTPAPTSVQSGGEQSGGGGGGGGGGGAATSEPYENIALKEVSYILSINPGDNVKKEMQGSEHGIAEVSFKYQTSAGEVSVIVEKLRDRSAFTSTSPSGIVYEYVNVLVSIPSERYLEDASIEFMVETGWLNLNSVSTDQIALYEYTDGNWNRLVTNIVSRTDSHIFYSSRVNAFSRFAIVAEKSTAAQFQPDQNQPLAKQKLSLSEGWNLLSIPLINSSITAKELANNGVRYISTFDPETREFRTYIAGFSSDDENFDIKPSQGFYAYADDNTAITIEGTAARDSNISLSGGWNLIGLTSTSEYDITTFIKELAGKAKYVAKFDPGNSSYNIHVVNFSEEEFKIEPGFGYWIYVDDQTK